MEVEIKVISKEIITPSSPTPNDVSNYKLSFLDQMSSIYLMPQTIFYESTGGLSKIEISNHLKKTLSKTLSVYYPLAGRVVDNIYVNCTDQGITFVEAQADCQLLDLINEPGTKELDKLLPRNLAVDVVTDLCNIQATFFDCGGLAIGVAVSHKLADAWSFFLFVNCWAAISRGDAHIQSPIFNGATIFPPRSDMGGYDPRKWMVNKEDIITKRFMFTASKINDLRDIYTNTSRATRIEALSAFIWTRFMVSTQTKDDLIKKSFTLVHSVNIRKRVIPPLSDELFGNYIDQAIVMPSLVDVGEGTYNGAVVDKIREAIRSRTTGAASAATGEDYKTRLLRGNQTSNSIINERAEKYMSGEIVPFNFTSLCRFPLFEADFGWGKPLRIGFGSAFMKNIAFFVDSFSGDGIDAWITLKVEDMAMFEADQELLAYAGK